MYSRLMTVLQLTELYRNRNSVNVMLIVQFTLILWQWLNSYCLSADTLAAVQEPCSDLTRACFACRKNLSVKHAE